MNLIELGRALQQLRLGGMALHSTIASSPGGSDGSYRPDLVSGLSGADVGPGLPEADAMSAEGQTDVSERRREFRRADWRR